MKEFAGSPFWRSIAVGLVLGLLLIGIGLFRQSPVSLTAPAHASQLVDMAEGRYATTSADGSILYIWLVEQAGSSDFRLKICKKFLAR